MAKTARSAQTVSIACKLPQGLEIHLPDMPQPVKLHGFTSPFALAGHGITQGIPVDVWEAIKVRYADAAWLKNGHVFANGDPKDTNAEATERKGVKAGFEPVDPNELPGGITNAD